MADYKILVGSDWSTAGNWSDNLVPVSNTQAAMDSSPGPEVNAGLDQGGVDLDALLLPRLFERNLGSSSNPLKIAADLVLNYSAGNLYFECAKDGVSALKTDEIHIECAHARAKTEIGGETGDAGDIDLINIMRGNVILKSNIAFGASAIVRVGYVSNRISDVNLLIDATTDTLATLDMSGGICRCNCQITNATITGQGTSLTHDTNKITGTLKIMAGARCIFNHEALNADGTVIEVHSGGILDLTQNSKEKTIATLRTFPGSTIIYDIAGEKAGTGMHHFTTWDDRGGRKLASPGL